MFSNYLKIAFRVLWRNKIYVVLNVVGLGFAIACCILSYLNYNYRENFDRNHPHTEQIYRLNSMRVIDGSTQSWGVVPLPLAEAMARETAGAERIARLSSAAVVVKTGQYTFDEQIHYADKTLFDFFNFPIKYGNLSGFDQSNQIIISEAFADKYFPKQIPVGQSLTLISSGGKPEIYTVAAVTQQIPGNSSIQFNIITSFKYGLAHGQLAPDDWANPSLITTFVELKNANASHFVKTNLNPYVALHNRNRSEWPIAGFTLEPFSSIAASSDIDMPGYVYGSQLTSNPRGILVIVPAIMSLFILLITCFNFTNISIAFASSRLKEIGIRKVMGGYKRQLIWQFLTENIVLCLLAAAIALLFVHLLLPTVNQLTGIDLSPDYSRDYALWLFLLCIPAVSAIFSGLYPAVYVSSFQPLLILKGKTALGAANRFTHFLMISQFSLSCFALVVGIVMSQNASFQQKVDFGYAINELAVVEINNPQEYRVFSQTIQQNPEIKSVAGSVQQIGDGTYTQTAQVENIKIQTQVAQVGGEGYLNTMGIRLLQGRHFHNTDVDASILVNETFLQRLQIKQPLGQQVTLDSMHYTIVGVVNDYKEYGLHGLVPPCVLRMAKPDEYKFMVVRTDKDKLPQVTKYLQAAWHQLVPNIPYRGYLQSDLIEKEIRMTQAFKSIAFFLAIITLLLSASGLFAQISLNIDKKSKEIGIRKVLGASILQIIGLVNREFIRILLIAFVIGSTLGYLFTSKFIFQVIYQYHPAAGPVPYISTFFIMLLCCSAIIGTRVFHAARANPIDRLRAE
ncbi:ABC transporter permease [Chitinophaga arvensicola]|uniref:MacB-like core domain-containing protein n=1 Tax=Chitinophaga arvensicola TaxID=29529 RepID=A0A1I0S8C0_9BACT|nr:ABC transporter permease [Chitinophaga arvensicola]SEW52340.1 MacB-like core domain-containing protein [Chitinophaga arvensicola]